MKIDTNSKCGTVWLDFDTREERAAFLKYLCPYSWARVKLNDGKYSLMWKPSSLTWRRMAR